MISSLSAGLGDLPDDLLGSTNPSLKLGRNSGGDSLSEELSMMFSKRITTNINLIPNDTLLSGIQTTNPDANAQKEQRIADALKTAKLKATLGKDSNEIFQGLRQVLSDDEISSLPSILELLDNPFIWSMIIDDPTAFENCDQAGQILRKIGRKSLFVLSSPKCADCRNNSHDRCLKLGKKLIKSLDFTPQMFAEISDALRMQGLIASDKTVASMEDIKHILAHKSDRSTRIYTAPKRQPAPIVPLHEVMTTLQARSVDKAKEEHKQAHRDFLNAELKPMAQRILSFIYKGASEDEIRHQVESTVFSPERRKSFATLYHALDGNPLVKSRLMFPPIIFDSCRQAKEFLSKNGIKAVYIKQFSRCEGCLNKNNGSCLLLGGTLLSPDSRVSEHERLMAIDDLLVNRQISAAQAQKCMEIETNVYLAGLRDAHKKANQKPRITASKSTQGVNSFVESAARFADGSNALTMVIDQLSAGVPISSVRSILRSQLSKTAADETLEQALFSLSSISADTLDDCTQCHHQFRAGAVLVRTGKCSSCSYAASIECLKTKLAFAAPTSLADSEETAEAKEILDMFYDPERRIAIKGDSRTAGLGIELNTDSGTVYDLGLGNTCDLPDLTAGEMIVNINQRSSGENLLDVQELGTGWDIGNCV
jgi:hypothetical protein